MLMGRSLRIWTSLSSHAVTLTPEREYLTEFGKRDKEEKEKQKANYDQRHCVRDLSDLASDVPVWVHTQGRVEPGRVTT